MKLNQIAALALASLITPSAMAVTAKDAAAGGNQLGIKLVREMAQGRAGENLLVSPFSAQIALSMALSGTDGHTRKSLLASLGLPDTDLASVNAAAKNLLETLYQAKKETPQDFRGLVPPTLLIANGAWNTNGATDGRIFKFAEGYKGILQQSYNAEMDTLDFVSPASADVINAWVSKNTNKFIPKIIDPDTLKTFLWALINAVYLEAQWTTPFTVMHATQPNFTTADNTHKTVEMITSQAAYAYVASPNADAEAAVEIPFFNTQNTELVFTAVLPTKGGDVWRSGFWNEVINSLAQTRPVLGRVTMPKFAYDDSVEMRKDDPLTEAVGLGFLFADNADFSKMATKDSLPSAVGLIKQMTRIELDEKGIKAAAATLVGGVERSSSLPQQPKFEIEFNRPFAYAIVEKKTGTVLFIGAVADPEAK